MCIHRCIHYTHTHTSTKINVPPASVSLSLINTSTHRIPSHWFAPILTGRSPSHTYGLCTGMNEVDRKKTAGRCANPLATFCLDFFLFEIQFTHHKIHLFKVYNLVVSLHSQSCTTITTLKFQNISTVLRVLKFKCTPTLFHQVLDTGEYSDLTWECRQLPTSEKWTQNTWLDRHSKNVTAESAVCNVGPLIPPLASLKWPFLYPTMPKKNSIKLKNQNILWYDTSQPFLKIDTIFPSPLPYGKRGGKHRILSSMDPNGWFNAFKDLPKFFLRIYITRLTVQDLWMTKCLFPRQRSYSWLDYICKMPEGIFLRHFPNFNKDSDN